MVTCIGYCRIREAWLALRATGPLLLILLVASCSQNAGEVVQVEVEPGQFLAVTKHDTANSTRISIIDGKRELSWEGPEFPFVLRRHEQRFHMILYDYPKAVAYGMRKSRGYNAPLPQLFKYFQETGNRFTEIPKEEFPPKLAYQNMWTTILSKQELLALKERDIESSSFVHSRTALMWADLSGSYPKEEVGIDKNLLRRFIETHQPDMLTFEEP